MRRGLKHPVISRRSGSPPVLPIKEFPDEEGTETAEAPTEVRQEEAPIKEFPDEEGTETA